MTFRSACRSPFVALFAGWVALAALTAPLPAQSPRWTSLGPDGGSVVALTPDPRAAGGLYAAAAEGGIFKTTDAGATWRSILRKDAPSKVAVDPARPSVLYAIAYPGAVWKSVDAGGHWTPINQGLATGPGLIRSIAVDPALRTRLYLGTNVGVIRSLNAGGSWQASNQGLPGIPVTALEVASRPAGTVFVGTAQGLYRSTNGGTSWQRLSRGLPALAVAQLAPAPSDPRTLYVLLKDRGLYRTTDGGTTWKPVVGPPAATNQIRSLVVAPHSTQTLYAALQGGDILRTTDGARRWRTIGRLPGELPGALTPDPFSSRRIYAGLVHEHLVAGGVFRSDDAGVNWNRNSTGLSGLATVSVDVDPTDPLRIWTSAESLLFRSENRGLRWFRVAVPDNAVPVGPTVLAPPSGALFQQGQGGLSRALWRTANDGASWSAVVTSSDTQPSQILLFRGSPAAPETLFAFRSRPQFFPPVVELLRSTDAGATWQTVTSGFPLICGLGELAAAPSNPAIVYVSGRTADPVRFCNEPTPAGLLRSEDGGLSFTSAAGGLPPGFVSRIAIDPADAGTVYAAFGPSSLPSSNTLWRTNDGGATWSPASAPAEAPVIDLIATASPARLYAAVEGGRVLRSEDGGVTWNDVSAGLLTRRVFELRITPLNPDRLYAATANGVWALEGGGT